MLEKAISRLSSLYIVSEWPLCSTLSSCYLQNFEISSLGTLILVIPMKNIGQQVKAVFFLPGSHWMFELFLEQFHILTWWFSFYFDGVIFIFLLIFILPLSLAQDNLANYMVRRNHGFLSWLIYLHTISFNFFPSWLHLQVAYLNNNPKQ